MPFGWRSPKRAASAPRAGDPADAERLRYWWRQERATLLAALAAVPPAARDEPLADDSWSPAGLAAHRLFWEAEERAALEEYLGGAVPSLLNFPTGRIDAANAAAVASLGERRLAALLRALRDLRERTATLVAQIPDADLAAPGNPARILLGVALEHDREHRRELQARYPLD